MTTLLLLLPPPLLRIREEDAVLNDDDDDDDDDDHTADENDCDSRSRWKVTIFFPAGRRATLLKNIDMMVLCVYNIWTE